MMYRNKILLYIPKLLLILVFLFLNVCILYPRQLQVERTDTSRVTERAVIRKDGRLDFLKSEGSVIISIDIEIAETPESRGRGLMYRELSDFTKGMLFVFQDAKLRTFWMHDTPTSLDIIFIGEDFRITNIAKHTTPMSDQLYISKLSAKYVVEVKAGFTERYGVKEGTKISWERCSHN